jgi:hypothetical protein
MINDLLVDAAKKAIVAVFADKTVSIAQVREGLEELQIEIELRLDALIIR